MVEYTANSMIPFTIRSIQRFPTMHERGRLHGSSGRAGRELSRVCRRGMCVEVVKYEPFGRVEFVVGVAAAALEV
jgi:hypothetical protein